jgi:hypothetical protein
MSSLVWNAPDVVDEIRSKTLVNVQAATNSLEKHVKTKISRPGAGIPSAPGEPPHMQTGELLESVDQQIQVNPTEIIGTVYTTSPYAMRLEFGFVGIDVLGRHYDQAPRPWLRPSLAETEQEIAQILGVKR